jgi:hypothetical protein
MNVDEVKMLFEKMSLDTDEKREAFLKYYRAQSVTENAKKVEFVVKETSKADGEVPGNV